MNRSILVFGDTHFPYHHNNTLKFLSKVKRRYKPDLVVCVGDLIDGYNANQYLKDPDHFHTAYQELQETINVIDKLSKLFPGLLLCIGNHDVRHENAARRAGLSTRYLKGFREMFYIPGSWMINDHHKVTVQPGSKKRQTKILFKHYSGANSLTEAERAGCSFVQGHIHKKCNVQWSSTGSKLLFGVNVPSLISDKGCPYSYDKLSNQRPVRGCVMILDGNPFIIPMR